MNADAPIDQIPLHALRLDGGTQSRVAIDEAVIADYAASLTAGDTLPPVVAFFDGADFWLADGFHRYHAHRAIEADEIPGYVHEGTKRDAIMYSVGANHGHGLRRSNEDKRKAVSTLLADAEWAAWSNIAIAKACGVSDRFVGLVRTAISEPFGDSVPPVTRTVERAGKTYEQKTANIGKARPAPAAECPEPEVEVQPAPDVATPRVTPEQGAAAVTELAALLAENAELAEELADLKATLADTLADNEMMGRVFDADDQVKASMEEALRYRAVAEQANRALAGRSQEFTERARLVVHWKNRAEKAEKQLAKAA